MTERADEQGEAWPTTSAAPDEAPDPAEVPSAADLFGPDPWVGVLLAGRYRIKGRIGTGGASNVYLAEHVHLARRFAVKIMHDSRVGDAVARQRFLNEGKVAGRIGHPNIVEWTDMGFGRDGVPFLVMELLEGRNLEEELAAVGPLPVDRAASICGQIAAALEAAHAAGVIHRDLKTSNVILLADDHVKVLDFGISKLLGAAGPALTHRSRVVGTPQYMAPEQLVAPSLVGVQTDVYALGVILYELVTGHLPFDDLSVTRCIELVLEAPAPSLALRRPDLPRGYARLVERALSKAPRDRPSSMGEVRAALEAVRFGAAPVLTAAPAPAAVVDGVVWARLEVPTAERSPAPSSEPSPLPGPGEAPVPSGPGGRPVASRPRDALGARLLLLALLGAVAAGALAYSHARLVGAVPSAGRPRPP